MISLNASAAQSEVQRHLAHQGNKQQEVIEELSSGKRINEARDDAAGAHETPLRSAASRVCSERAKGFGSVFLRWLEKTERGKRGNWV